MTKEQIENLGRAAANKSHDLQIFCLGFTYGVESVESSRGKKIATKAKTPPAKKVVARRKRGQITELLLKTLPHSSDGAMTLSALARRARIKNPVSANGPLKKLIKDNVAKVTGAGGKGDPFRYWGAANGIQ